MLSVVRCAIRTVGAPLLGCRAHRPGASVVGPGPLPASRPASTASAAGCRRPGRPGAWPELRTASQTRWCSPRAPGCVPPTSTGRGRPSRRGRPCSGHSSGPGRGSSPWACPESCRRLATAVNCRSQLKRHFLKANYVDLKLHILRKFSLIVSHSITVAHLRLQTRWLTWPPARCAPTGKSHSSTRCPSSRP